MTTATLHADSRRLTLRGGGALPVTLATVALFVVSPLVAAGSLGTSSLATMLPFAAILAVASLGQTLVVQQGGLDFSVAGSVSLAAVVLTRIADQQASRLPFAVLITMLVGALVGLLSGLAVTRLRITPLIATLGVNALLLGAVRQISGGLSVVPAPSALTNLALGKTLGVFNIVIFAVLLLALFTLIMKRTVAGRRFEASGASPAAARAAGIRVHRYTVSAYVLASVSYAMVGVLLAGFLSTPTLDIGNSYLLATIAAVVVGGTALRGGRGSAVASAIGALFLTQLSQVLLATGAPTSINLLVQGVVIGVSMAARSWIGAAQRRRRAQAAPKPDVASGDPAFGEADPERIDASTGLALAGITKSFPGVLALREVSLHVRPGEVHALVGENGAGKSTLMAIAAGVLAPDAGSVHIDGQPVASPTPAQMRERGLAVVYQHPALLPDLTVAENLALGVPRRLRPRFSKAESWSRDLLAAVGLDLPGHRRLCTLSLAERHLVEIAKAFAAQPKVLILDEPTEPLSAAETQRLFAAIRRATVGGVAVVYISHRLRDVERIADRMTVLRDGRTRGTFAVGELTEDDILRLIVGRPVDTAFPAKPADGPDSPPLVEIRSLTGQRFSDVSATLRPGEIVGLAGIDGNGQQDFIRALAGLTGAAGTVSLDGAPIRLGDPAAALAAGIVYLPADRHGEALLGDLSVRENITLLTLPRYARHGLLDIERETGVATAQATALAIKTPTLSTEAGTLSGGNQQKTMFARSLLAKPRVLLADEPTQGVDAGARIELYRHLRATADAGACVVVRSSDAIELDGLCDRVLVFSRGHVVKELAGAEISEAGITHAIVTSTQLRREASQERPSRSLFRSRLGEERSGDRVPSALLALVALVLGGLTAARHDAYLSEFNLRFFLLSLAALGFIALGQFVVVMLGGIDLSLGPLASFLVVTASWVMTGSTLSVMLSVLLLAVLAIGNGLMNGLLIRTAQLNPVIATLVTFFLLQGLALLLRPTPDGEIPLWFADAVQTSVGFVPIAFVVLVALVVLVEVLLHRSRWGVELRATGSDETAAHRLGIRTTRHHFAAYVISSLCTVLGALMLAGQIAVGDASAGTEFTLAGIAAVVIGGTSILGGRGAALGVLVGALLLQQITNVSTFLQLGSAWQYWFLGGLTLLAATLYSRLRTTPTPEGRTRP